MRWHHSVTVGAAVVGGLATLVPAAAGATNSMTTVNVVAGKPSEFRFTLSKKTFPHGSVMFVLTNAGTQPHDFKICASPKGGSSNACTGKLAKQIIRGQAATLTYTFKEKASYEFLCTVPGHAAAGMKGVLKVT
jgi:uncharacterized cupredoxin-like copper-binding protein